MEEGVKYTRVAVKDIPPAPQAGFYITSADTKTYCILLGIVFTFFSALLLFGQRRNKT